ncbi:MAG: T9SS type A sorting domain-containing protein [Bacteroidia bacterium]|nr:T9SS type A sorting domain-containing protein [Bacteroidia bacterium]
MNDNNIGQRPISQPTSLQTRSSAGLTINNNVISNLSGVNASYHPDGIFVSEATAVNNPLPYRIRYNNIDMGSGNIGQRLGIYARNMAGVSIDHNNVRIKNYNSDPNSGNTNLQMQPGGIVVESSFGFRITCNTIQGALTSSTTNYWNWTKGIGIANNQSSKGIFDNSITNTGIGWLSIGNNAGTKGNNNHFNRTTAKMKAIQLQGGSLLNGGDQGNGTTFSGMTGSDFHGYTAISAQPCTMNVLSVGSFISGSNITPPMPIVFNGGASSDLPGCPYLNIVVPPPIIERLIAIDSIVVPDSFPDSKTLYRLGLYMAYKTDSATQADTIITAFADTFRYSPWGKLMDLNMKQFTGMGLREAEILYDANDSIIPIDTISSILKKVNKYLFSKAVLNDTSYTSTEKEELETVAQLCPSVYGPWVYTARDILEGLDTFNIHYYNICELSQDSSFYRVEEQASNNSITSEYFRLYPNPATEELTFEYILDETSDGTITFYDLSGRRVLTTNTQKENRIKQINTTNLQSGIYLMNFKVNGTIKYFSKLCIVK